MKTVGKVYEIWAESGRKTPERRTGSPGNCIFNKLLYEGFFGATQNALRNFKEDPFVVKACERALRLAKVSETMLCDVCCDFSLTCRSVLFGFALCDISVISLSNDKC